MVITTITNEKKAQDIINPLKLAGGQQQHYNSKLKSVGPSFAKAIVRKKIVIVLLKMIPIH